MRAKKIKHINHFSVRNITMKYDCHRYCGRQNIKYHFHPYFPLEENASKQKKSKPYSFENGSREGDVRKLTRQDRQAW